LSANCSSFWRFFDQLWNFVCRYLILLAMSVTTSAPSPKELQPLIDALSAAASSGDLVVSSTAEGTTWTVKKSTRDFDVEPTKQESKAAVAPPKKKEEEFVRAVGPLNGAKAQSFVTRWAEEITASASAIAEAESEVQTKVETVGIDKAKQMKLVQAKADFEKKRKAAQNVAAVSKSLAVTKARLEKIQRRQDKIVEIADLVKHDAASLAQDQEFIQDLIVQSCLMLLEDKVTVRCRTADVGLVQSCLAGASQKYAATIREASGATKTLKLTVDQSNPLSAGLIGGVVLCINDGDISVDNTIDARLSLVLEQDKPAIRRQLFSKD